MAWICSGIIWDARILRWKILAFWSALSTNFSRIECQSDIGTWVTVAGGLMFLAGFGLCYFAVNCL